LTNFRHAKPRAPAASQNQLPPNVPIAYATLIQSTIAPKNQIT